MQTTRQKAVAALVNLASSDDADSMARVAALNSVIRSQDTLLESMDSRQPVPFYSLSTRAMCMVFLKCTFAVLPAVLLSFALYVITLFLSTAFVQLVVGI